MNKRQAKKKQYKEQFFSFGVKTWKEERQLKKDVQSANSDVTFYRMKSDHFDF